MHNILLSRNQRKQRSSLDKSLPRGSKNNHKYLFEASVQKPKDAGPLELTEKKNRKNQ